MLLFFVDPETELGCLIGQREGIDVSAALRGGRRKMPVSLCVGIMHENVIRLIQRTAAEEQDE